MTQNDNFNFLFVALVTVSFLYVVFPKHNHRTLKVSESKKKKQKIFYFATYPHTGNTWIRETWDLSTGIGSESVYEEYGVYDNRTKSFGSECGSSGGRYHKRKHGSKICKLFHRATQNETLLIKTHYPTLQNHARNHLKNYDGVIITERTAKDWCKSHWESFQSRNECEAKTRVKMEIHNKYWLSKNMVKLIIDYEKMKTDKSYAYEKMQTLLKITGTKQIRDGFEWNPGKYW